MPSVPSFTSARSKQQVLKEEQKLTREQQLKQQVKLELMENMEELLLVVVLQ